MIPYNNFQNITDSYPQKSIVIYTKIVRIDKVCNNVPTSMVFFLNVKQYLVNVLFIDLIYESICSTIYTGNTKLSHFLLIRYESQYMDPYKRNKRVYGVALMKSLYIDKCLNGFMFISFTLRVISESPFVNSL